jgi:hypothetical protein
MAPPPTYGALADGGMSVDPRRTHGAAGQSWSSGPEATVGGGVARPDGGSMAGV